MKKCMDCNSNVSTATVKYMDRLARTHQVEAGTYYCLNCQVRHNLNTFDSRFSPKPVVEAKKNNIKFDIGQFDLIRNIKPVVGVENNTQLNKHIVYAYLKVMAHVGHISKAYLTRVNNKNTSFVSASKYVQSKLEEGFGYYILAERQDESTILLALVERDAIDMPDDNFDYRNELEETKVRG